MWPLHLKGHFAGPFGSGIRNAPIPLITIPEKFRKSYEQYECRQSVAGVEATLAAVKPGQGSLDVSTGDLAVALGGDINENQYCVQVWAELAPGNLVELLNSVRNRILDFALAIWKTSPTAGELSVLPDAKIQAAQVTQIFETTVYGGSATFVGSAPNSSLVNFNIVSGDFESLRAALREQGISTEDVQDLQAALSKDARPLARDRLGSGVSSWIGKMVKKAAEGTWNAGVTIAGKILSDAITKYYGLP